MRAGEAALPSSTACCAMPEAPGVTLCARFRSCAAAGDVARLIWNGTAGKSWGAAPHGCRRDGCRRGQRDSPWVAAPVPVGRRYRPKSRSACSPPGWPGEKSPASPASPRRSTRGCPRGGAPYLLDGGQALELGAGEVLLLERRRLQHQVLLLRRVHLLQVLRRRVGLPVQRLLDHLLGGCKHILGLHPNTKTLSPQTSSPPKAPKIAYLDGLAVGDAAVDGDLGCGWAGGAGAAGCRGGAAGAAGGRRCRELLVLHGGLPGRREAAGVRLELGGGQKRVRGGHPTAPKVGITCLLRAPAQRSGRDAGMPVLTGTWGCCIPPPQGCMGWE